MVYIYLQIINWYVLNRNSLLCDDNTLIKCIFKRELNVTQHKKMITLTNKYIGSLENNRYLPNIMNFYLMVVDFYLINKENGENTDIPSKKWYKGNNTEIEEAFNKILKEDSLKASMKITLKALLKLIHIGK